MKNCYTTVIAGFLLFFIAINQLRAQAPILADAPAKENFNTLTTGFVLPANWRISAAGQGSTVTWATGLNSVTQAANSGAPAAGGSYNWGTAAGTDRAAGFLSSAGYASPNAVMAHFRNNTGAAVTTLTVSFAVERYRINTSAFSLAFSSSPDGTVWTERSAGNISSGVFMPDAAGYTFDTPATVVKTVTLTGLSIAPNTDIFFRWVFTDAAPSNAQGLALDDVSVTAGAPIAVISATLTDILKTDNPPVNEVNSGDELTYRTSIRNNGTGEATDVMLTEPAPANTTLIGGSVKTSTLARDEVYTTLFDTPLSGSNVLSNDYGLPAPAVISFGPVADKAATAAGGSGSSDNGGTVVLNADGTLAYTPPAGFSGNDRFGYIAGNGNLPDNDAVVTVSVGNMPAANADTYNVVGNVPVSPNSAAGILSNDTGGGLLVTAVNGNAANVGTALVTGAGGNLTVNTDGSFTYNPAPGYNGSDSFTYTADNGFSAPASATVTLNIAGVVWFVNNNAASNGDGRLGSPFKLITNVTGTAAGQTIFLYESATAYSGSITLLSAQKLIGQDASESLQVITGLTPNAIYSAQFPAMNSGNGVNVSLTSANANIITLGSGNTIRGVTVGNAGTGKKITGSNFGTLTLGNSALPDVILSGTGQALDLQTGTLTGGLLSLTTTGSIGQGVSINSVAGTYHFGPTSVSGSATQGILIAGASAIVPTFGATTVNSGTDGVSIQGNTGNVTFGSLGITTANGIGLLGTNNTGQVIVTNGTSGISATGGAAINLSQSSGTSVADLKFSGLTSTGGANGVYLNNIAGTISGGTGSLTGTGTAFYVNGGAVSITYGGTVTHNAATFYLADIRNITGGAINLGGNLSADGASLGIRVADTNGANVTFGGTSKALTTGAAAAVTLSFNGSSNIIFSNGGLVINTTSGTGLNATGDAGSLEVSGAGNTVTTTSGTCINLANINAAANGITFDALTTATGRLAGINGSGGVKTLGRVQQTDANGSGSAAALSLDNAATVNIGGAAAGTVKTTTGTGIRIADATTLNISGAGLDVTTTTGKGIDISSSTIAAGASGLRIVTAGGTGVQALASGIAAISGSANSVSTPGGIALNVSSGTANFSFQSVSASGGSSNAIAYNAAGGTTTIGGGAITGNSSAVPFFVSGGTASISYSGNITQANNVELVRIEGGHQTGTITFNTGTLTATNGTGLQFDNADGTYIFNGTTTLNGGDAGIDLINGTSGTFTFGDNTTITNPSGTAFNLSGITASNATVTYNGTITDNTGYAVDIDNHDANTVTFQTGNITSTANGIRVQNCGGGTINFNSPSKSLTTGANTAVTLNSNTGSTVNFGTSGLVISTSSGSGYNATGGGTVNVTGTGNSIVSTTGTALNVNATSIGSNNLNFQRISSNGATNGILLTSTGSTGGLTVTGTGTTAGSGGTIQNCLQRGARFVSAANISLSNMNFTNNGTANIDPPGVAGNALGGTNTNVAAGIDFQGVSNVSLTGVAISGGKQIGLNGKNVSNFSMSNSSVKNAGDENLEDGVQLTELAGNCTVSNCDFSGNYHRQFEVQNSVGSLTLNMTGSVFDRLTYQSTAAQGVLISGHGTAVINASVKSSVFRKNFGSGFYGQSFDNANVTITLGSNGISSVPAEGNTFTDNSLGFQLLSDNASNFTFNVGNNTYTVSSVVTSGSTPFSVRKGTNATGRMTGRMGFNTIGNSTALSGNNCAGCNGISFTNEGLSGGMNITVNNNTIQHINQRGIEALLQLNDQMSMTVTDNSFLTKDSDSGHAIFMQSGTDDSDSGDLCADIRGNSISGTWDLGSGNIRLRMFPVPAAGSNDSFRVRNAAGVSAPDIVAYLNANNTNAMASATTPSAFIGGSAPCP